MDSYDEIEGALQDVSNTSNVPDVADNDQLPQPSGPLEDPTREAAEKGWTDRTPYAYEEFNNKQFAEWAGNAQRYEWNDEYGDVGPRNEELEKQLFNVDDLSHAGLRLDRLNEIKVYCESEQRVQPIATWEGAGLHPIMRENIQLCLWAAPTAVQMYSIPAMLKDKDLIAVSQTGSGKTGAFLVPILSKLMGKAKKLAAPRPNVTAEDFNPRDHGVRAEPLVLIVCPTRELATQIFDDARRLCYRSMLRPCVVYGGVPPRFQREELQKGCDILIGTPGRIIDFMGQPNVLSFRRVKFTVIDEADELLQSDWEEDFKKIMSGGDANEDADHRYMMFSATFSKDCRKLARQYLSDNYVRIRIGRPGSSHLNIKQQVIYADDKMKNQALYDRLMTMYPVRTLVFVNSKDQVDFVDDYLFNRGLPSTSIHSGRTQREREDAIRAFRKAKCPVMVATGLSARGLDIANVMHVINYDLPRANHGGIEEYVHRIGRTARIGNEGLATSFYNDKDADLAPDLVKILLECEQPIPDFLEPFLPDENAPLFDNPNTDDEKEADDNPYRHYGETQTQIVVPSDNWGAQTEIPDETITSAVDGPPADENAGEQPVGESFAEPTEKPSHDAGLGQSQWARAEIDW